MSNNEDSLATPLNTRSRLALRRKAHTTANTRTQRRLNRESAAAENNETPTNSKQIQLEKLEDTKVSQSSENLHEGVTGINCTPRTIGLKRLSESTNCRPYRLTLNRNIREKLTKKRLQFHLANEAEKQQEENITPSDHERVPALHSNAALAVADTKADLLSSIVKAQQELRGLAAHTAKVKDLETAIHKWRTAFASALEDLHVQIEPRIEKKELLEKLGIAADMLKYAND